MVFHQASIPWKGSGNTTTTPGRDYGVCFEVGRSGFNFLPSHTQKTLQKIVFTAFMLGTKHKRDNGKKKQKVCLCYRERQLTG